MNHFSFFLSLTYAIAIESIDPSLREDPEFVLTLFETNINFFKRRIKLSYTERDSKIGFGTRQNPGDQRS